MTARDAFILEDWASPLWRLENLYWVLDDKGVERPFVPNEEQREYLANLHTRNCTLKARQIGLTTFIQLLQLDQCIFNKNFKAITIADTLPNAAEIFRTKIAFPWMKLPASLRDAVGVNTDAKTEYVFGNGSSIGVTTSARGGTLQSLHVSEFGKICARYPEKAREIVSGSFPAVVLDGGMIHVESTAKGQSGRFYDMTTAALRRQQEKTPETALDFRLHFFPWWRKKANSIDPRGVTISAELERYFAGLEREHKIYLEPGQKAWYAKTADELKEDMKSEHPSFPEEAFEVAIEGAILAKEMALLRKMGRVGSFPWQPRIPVNTFWDFGVDDANAIWFHQRVRGVNRLIGYFEDQGFGLGHYVNHMNGLGYVWGKHYLPHDANARQMDVGVTTKKQILFDLGIRNTKVVPAPSDINTGIDQLRTFLLTCEFDAVGCKDGIRMLDSYQREWDEKLGRFSTRPLHNFASHGCDALRQAAQGYEPDVTMPTLNSTYAVLDSQVGY